MQARADVYPSTAAWKALREAWLKEHAGYVDAVLEEVRDRGPLSASKLSDPRRRSGEWWERRSTGRVALEWLFGTGQLAAWRAPNFERVYDLPERVIPPDVLARPTPSVEDAHRALVLESARALGVATVADLADYFRLDQRSTRARLAELCESGTGPGRGLGPARLHTLRSPAAPAPPRHRHAVVPFRLAHLVPASYRPPVRRGVPHRDLRTGSETHIWLLRAALAPRR